MIGSKVMCSPGRRKNCCYLINKIIISYIWDTPFKPFLLMQSRHQQKYVIYLLIGFILVSAGILSISYLIMQKQPPNEWLMWSVIATVVINLGLLFLGSSVVHKVKADIKKRQKKTDNFN